MDTTTRQQILKSLKSQLKDKFETANKALDNIFKFFDEKTPNVEVSSESYIPTLQAVLILKHSKEDGEILVDIDQDGIFYDGAEIDEEDDKTYYTVDISL